ncbi:cytochrome c-type biogenesis protein [Marinobacter zhejiangensis]|uniref:Cytochrome c-type biogenesis protein n=1 Tax=Marinobacter zhejiangensis TaxID=488535 RepID=A0A1I4NQV9_9GAMM|nr:cytochrome c-type biogenesis protein [Marinobacter zhejiangensis]SFM17918.1 cytochrome c-type biogenesis protein CcmH [Marinobacter zhejiangensis]
MHRVLMLFVLLVMPVAATAVSEVYPFDSSADQERFRTLMSELRCPKCQNQNIFDSNAPIAKDMRDEVYRMLQDGATDQEVKNALVSRFGEFVLYKPEFSQRTVLLWVTPLIAVLGGVLIVIGVILRSRQREDDTAPLSEEERRKAERILSGDDNSPR